MLVPLEVVLLVPIFVTVLLELIVVAAKLEPPFSALADPKIALAALPVAVNLVAPLMRVSSAEAMSAFRALAIGCVEKGVSAEGEGRVGEGAPGMKGEVRAGVVREGGLGG